MAKVHGTDKNQKTISSFFGGRSKKTAVVSSSDEMSDKDVPTAPAKAKSVPSTTQNVKGIAMDLPPIHKVPAMFTDLVSRMPELKRVADHLSGRKLRVATMCSGTESPLLALQLICRSLYEEYNVKLEVEHVFSCEIEPFKQAYIERNFRPPLLFRDVCELGQGFATTAYGSLEPVPGNVDLLIAGTSCVDYSNLNNEKQDMDASGESGRTFRGMMSWVANHRPPLVILENVCSAPWDRVAEKFQHHKYSATWTRVDTKNYYIPHTRTRVYLVAVDERKSELPDSWKTWVTSKLKRQASCTLDAFLLPSDDQRIHEARQKLVQESYNALDRRTGRTDWSRCESRHQRARLEEGLGAKRPLTSWDEGGSCKLLDFAWSDWGVAQVERVWDLMDISLLRSAKNGVDPSYKTHVWNLSQNVDRNVDTQKAGICMCLTPSMIPYITNRGGPMVGLEALSMQGLPIDELLLTRETEDQLADLAGNAMSTTVVGSCIMAALVVGRKLLKEGTRAMNEDVEDSMDIDQPATPGIVFESQIIGEEQLLQKPLELSISNESDLSKILADAQGSARLCQCEGRSDVTDREVLRCVDCGSSSCRKCAGRPEHNFLPIDLVAEPRLSPLDFSKELKSALPMCMSVLNVNEELLDTLKDKAGVPIPEKRWKAWRAAVLRAVKYELRFAEPKRQEIWSAIYQSPTATLELLLHPKQPEWRLYAKPEEHEPANSDVRGILELPVARFSCVNGLLNGRWDFALPFATMFTVSVEGAGEPVPAWEARLGLTSDEFKDRVVNSKLRITAPTEDVSSLERDISGVYVLLDKCGTANSALHQKIGDDAVLPPLFLFLDPTRCGTSSQDSFVISISKRRYEYGETRPIICKLDPSWRPSSDAAEQKISCEVPVKWVASDTVAFQSIRDRNARFSVPSATFDITVLNDACRNANALLVCRVPLESQASSIWPRGSWEEVDKVHERATFKELTWLLERVRHVGDHFTSWQAVDLPKGDIACERCAPTAPSLKWYKANKKIVAAEDHVQAGEYERSLKHRPSPFITQLKLDEDGTGIVRVAINIPSLIHRALSRLPTANRPEAPTASWRLNTEFMPVAKLHLPKFRLSSNKLDPEHAQPPSFRIPLRKEQLRSLEWMLLQEAPDAPPFVEEEISEAVLTPLGWRAEGRAQRKAYVRGGVLADQVGYGKTAITLGLIDCASSDVKNDFVKLRDIKGKIPVKATLAIVPPHLTRQWASEVVKFTGRRFKIVVISTAANLNPVTIEDVQEADVVIVACNLFQSSVYLANLEAFAGAGTLPSQDGRYFNARLVKALAGLKTQVDRLRSDGSTEVMEQIREGRRLDEELTTKSFAPTKRLKGKSYREAAEIDLTKEEELAPLPRKAISNPSGLIPEVVMQVSRMPTNSTAIASCAQDTMQDEDMESDVLKRPPRRITSAKALLVDSDDNSASEGLASEVAESTTSSKQAQAPPSSEDEDYSSPAIEDESEDEDFVISDDEGTSRKLNLSKPKPGSSKKQIAMPSGKANNKSVSKDSKAAVKKGTKKRKADDDQEGTTKKQKRREDTDPWKLESRAVQKDWTQMQAPPLEMFHFARKVVDEYTYLDGKILSMVTKITADRHWVLSGTPPIHDFSALKTISAFLNLHLGVDDDGEGQSVQVKKRRREQTAVEKFHSFREVHTLEWHAHRHDIGQTFLDHFVRQNIAEIDEIPWTEKIAKVVLPAAERAIYLELEHHLRALDMTIKRGRKTESDREKRLAKALGESRTAEEALLKRCSHFDLETTDHQNAMRACDVIVKERQKQLDDCKNDLLRSLKEGVKTEKKIGKLPDESMFQEYVRVSRTKGWDDSEASDVVNQLLDEAGVAAPNPSMLNRTLDTSKSKARAKGNTDDSVPKSTKDLIWEHREKTHEIRRLTKELVGRVRSLRYFKVVRDLQKQADSPPVIGCPNCGRERLPIEEVAVLSSCGHMGCLTCVKACAEKEECVYAPSGSCKSAARVLNIVKASTLGVDDEARNGREKHYGIKLERIVHMIKKEIPKEERVLIFVQFPDLMKKVAEALSDNKVPFLEIKGSATQKSKNLEKFQNDSEERVLLLNVMDESASGANLTSANHAVFLSPLLAPTQEIYEACETQAIGRLRRYGQTKHVYVWRFLTTNTIDEEIYKFRTSKAGKPRS